MESVIIKTIKVKLYFWLENNA